ncbi:MAG: flap endonuclease-1 [Candidatus Nanohalarchaeota archaeon]|nr:MAG: flap endonuclease-1 [Candidatus Nanohaloarchaeota archaeon]
MGVKLSPILERQELNPAELGGKTLCVDAFNTIYQMLSSIRGADGELLKDKKGRVTSHLAGLFWRNLKLLKQDIKIIYVFDGKAPALKKDTQKQRRQRREEAYEKWQKEKEAGNLELAAKYAKISTFLTDEMIEDAKVLLRAMGIVCIQALSEGEAQAAFMAKKHGFYCCSQDYDAIVFGAPVLVRNLNANSMYGIKVQPEIIYQKKVLEVLGISSDDLINLAILCGTDFNPKGINGLGAKKSLALVKQYKSLDEIFKNTQYKWEFDADYESIYDFFKNPLVTEDYDLSSESFNRENIIDVLCGSYDFSRERIESSLNKFEKEKVTTLSKWFG